MIRVLVVDDHPIFSSGLAHLLSGQDDLEVAGVLADGADVGRAVRDLRPDVVLLDLSMPVVDGITATRYALAADTDVRVLVLTAFVDDDRVLAALDAGAAGYLLKDTGAAELLAGIRAVARGDAPMSAAAVRTLVRERHRRTADVHLTPR